MKNVEKNTGGAPFFTRNIQINAEAAQLISEHIARKYTLIPIGIKGKTIQVAMANPTDLKAIDDISVLTGMEIEPYAADAEQILIAIRQNLTIGKAENIVSEEEKKSIWCVEGSEYKQEDSPTIRLIDSLFKQAITEGASDIHWEPREHIFQVRFRLDGFLIKKSEIPIGFASSIAARLKLMAGIDVSERRLPQDGRMIISDLGKKIDIRVSTFPTVFGEKVVTRILDSDVAERPLANLGMQENIRLEVQKLLNKPHGLVLISGPTGSGKTTTLYALTRELPSDIYNIVSIEDPVEYRLKGVNQAQVQVKAGLDFAQGLRFILRQDPDIIMLGEIRDQETARIATAAALTGHLVISTIHTNNAAESLARLLDMQVEPYLLASAISGVLAQRLVRKLCVYCREPYEAAAPSHFRTENNMKEVYFRAVGCDKCNGTGFEGRTGIHEFLAYDPDIKELVLEKKSASIIEKAARDKGMKTLLEDGLLKARLGITSLEEVLRVAL